jgi:hypothetical protein
MTTYPDDADGSVLTDLAAHGVDMTKPLQIEFAVAAPDEDAATAIADALSKAGYDGHAEFDEGEPDADEDDDDDEFSPSWTVYASVTMVPEYDEIIRIQEELDRLAEPFDGYIDGWGVMLDSE